MLYIDQQIGIRLTPVLQISSMSSDFISVLQHLQKISSLSSGRKNCNLQNHEFFKYIITDEQN